MELFDSVFCRRIQTSRLSGEKRLLLAVLESAFNELVNNASRTDDHSRRRSDEVVAWIKSSDTTWPCTFQSICLSLDLDPNYLRKGITQYIGTCRMYPLGLALDYPQEIDLIEDKNSDQNKKIDVSRFQPKKVAPSALKKTVIRNKDYKPNKANPNRSILPASQMSAYEARKQRAQQHNQEGFRSTPSKSKSPVPASQMSAYEARRQKIKQRNQEGY